MIYADHAATTKISDAARDSMLHTMETAWGNPSSLHTPGQKAKEILQDARATIARLIGANEKEIYFTSSGSEADNQAIYSAAFLGAKKNKRHIVSTTIEHHAVLHSLEALERQGYEVTLVPVDATGIVKVADIEAALREDTALVTVMFANNEIGTIQPIGEIGALCRARGVLFHTDAVQAAGHLHIDVKEMNIDLLSLSGHKFHGPRGVGALYARTGVSLTSLIEGGAQERGKRAGTENLPAIAGMATALEEACRNLDQNAAYVRGLRDSLITGLARIPHSALNGDAQQRLPGNVSFCFEGIEGEAMLLLLNAKGIAASSGSACTSGSLDPSHVLLAIGRPHEVAHGSLRLSLSEHNTPQEVETMISAVEEVVTYLRGMSPVWSALLKGEKNYVIH